MNRLFRVLRGILITSILFYSSGCEKWIIHSEPDATAPAVFETLWQEFDLYYPFFEIKKVNWDSLYNVYRPQVSPSTTPADLLVVLTSLLATLKDGHVGLYDAFLEYSYKPWNIPSYVPHDEDIVTARYLKLTARLTDSGNFLYGRISDTLGYLEIKSFSNQYLQQRDFEEIDQILYELRDCTAMIIDVRDNGGGSPEFAEVVASRFADQPRIFAYYRYRNGPNHNDFSPYIPVTIEPRGSRRFVRPVAILTNIATFSAAEHFVLAMGCFPHVTIIGDSTGGGLGIPIYRELPNGWIFRLPRSMEVDADTISYEGKGIPPDIYVINTREEKLFDADRVLAKAIQFLLEK